MVDEPNEPHVHEVPPPDPRTALGPARGLLVLGAFAATQFVVALLIGMFVGLAFGLTGRKIDGQALIEAQRIAVLPSAILVTVIGGLLALAVTYHMARGPTQAKSLKAIGWAGSTRRQAFLGALAGVSVALVNLMVASVISPSSDISW